MTVDYNERTAQADNDHLLSRLAEELGELRAENARLSAELQAQKTESQTQRGRLAALEGKAAVNGRSDAKRSFSAVEAPDADVTRRGLLWRLGAATAAGAGVAVGTSLFAAQPAAAGTDGDLVLEQINSTSRPTTLVKGSGLVSNSAGALYVRNEVDFDVESSHAIEAHISKASNRSSTVVGSTVGRGAGVQGFAFYGEGVGLRATSGRAHLLLDPARSAGAPTTGAHDKGEVFVDSAGILYHNVATSTPGTWRKLTSGAPGFAARSGSINFLAAPFRLFDTRSGAGTKLAAGATLTVQATNRNGIPLGAVGVVGNLAVTDTQAPSGYLTLYPQGAAVPTASNINWFAAGQTLANNVVVGLNPANGQLTVHNGAVGGSAPTHVILDIAGFVF